MQASPGEVFFVSKADLRMPDCHSHATLNIYPQNYDAELHKFSQQKVFVLKV